MTGLESEQRREYHLSCTVKVKDISYLSGLGNQLSSKVVLLEIEPNSQAMKFWDDWLPATVKRTEKDLEELYANYEMIAEIGYPFHGHIRVASMRANDRSDKHHLMIMSQGAEEIFKVRDNEKITVKCLPDMTPDEEQKLGF